MRIFHNPDHAAHDPRSELHRGRLTRGFERPERMQAVLAGLADAGFAAPEAPGPPPEDLLHRVHDGAYLAFLESAHRRWVAAHGAEAEGGPPDALAFAYPVHGLRRAEPPEDIGGALGHYGFSVDTCITAGAWAAALSAAACASAAADAAASGPAFALARPPGHHAHADLYGGYCYLNNAALAAERLIAAGAGRVAILDIDYHHGNGTQSIFYSRADVLFVSIHADPAREFPYFLGHREEHGAGPGAGHTVNFPLARGADAALWSSALEEACRRIADFSPGALVVSLGTDTLEGDPIGGFRLAESDFPPIGARIAALALPTVFVMEGGYAIDALGRTVAGMLGGFLGA